MDELTEAETDLILKRLQENNGVKVLVKEVQAIIDSYQSIYNNGMDDFDFDLNYDSSMDDFDFDLNHDGSYGFDYSEE